MSEPASLRALLRGLPVLTGKAPLFDAGAVPNEPHELFEIWLRCAIEAGVREPHAMTVSTVGRGGVPHSRVLIVKDVDADGWHFGISSVSQKGNDLASTPAAALTFYWPEQARQVRVEGPTVSDPTPVAAADFRARGIGSRLMAMTGRQSQPLHDTAELDEALDKARGELDRNPALVPPEWTSYCVRPSSIEFWQGDPQRRHTRLRYERDPAGTWARQRLWP